MKNPVVIDKIKIKLVNPSKGLLGFASFMLFESLCCTSVAIKQTVDGNMYLGYPKRKTEEAIQCFFPTKRWLGTLITVEVLNAYREEVKKHSNEFEGTKLMDIETSDFNHL